MKLKILSVLLLTVTLSAKSIEQYNNDFNRLSTDQIKVITNAFNFGSKYNMQWSLAAIAWQESNAGLAQISMTGSDYGICQINIKTFLARNNIKDTSWNRSKFATLLITSPGVNYLSAIEELTYWNSKRKPWQSYRVVWSGYNAGHRGNSEYAEAIAKRIQVLKRYYGN